jgi:translation initiation factor 3 subunit H
MADRKVKSEAAGAGVAAPPAAKKDGVIDLVQIDGLAVLKIIKHCHEETSGVMDVAQGVLLGLVSDNKLEITNSFPFPRAPDENMDEGK